MKSRELQVGKIYNNEKHLHRKIIAVSWQGIDYIKVARNVQGEFYEFDKHMGKPIVYNCCVDTFMKWAKREVTL